MQRLIVVMGLFLMAFSSFAWVKAEVDDDTVASGHAIILTVSTDQSQVKPDFTPLQKHFQILSTRNQHSTRNINGKFSQQTSWQLDIVPLKTPAGKSAITVTIPPIQVGKSYTKAVSVQVFPANVLSPNSTEIFLKSAIMEPTVFVGQQMTYQVKLYFTPDYARRLIQASLSEPQVPGLRFIPLGAGAKSSERIDGQLYQVITQSFALFPKEAGSLQIPGLVFHGEVREDPKPGRRRDPYYEMMLMQAGNHIKPLQIVAPTQEVVVQAPKGDVAAWLPAHHVEASRHFGDNLSHLHVGDLLTQHVMIEAWGAMGSQIPSLPPLQMDHVNTYPASPKRGEHIVGNYVVGQMKSQLGIMFTAPGDYTIPALDIPWWDTKHGKFEMLQLAAITVHVAPAVASAEAKKPAQKTSTTDMQPPAMKLAEQHGAKNPVDAVKAKLAASVARHPLPQVEDSHVIRWVVLGIFILWLFTSLGWWFHYRRLQQRFGVGKWRKAAESTPESLAQSAVKAVLGEIKRACRQDDFRMVQRLLHQWLTVAHPSIRSVEAWAASTGNESLIDAIAALEARCFSQDVETAWSGREFFSVFIAAVKKDQGQQSGKSSSLCDLYP